MISQFIDVRMPRRTPLFRFKLGAADWILATAVLFLAITIGVTLLGGLMDETTARDIAAVNGAGTSAAQPMKFEN